MGVDERPMREAATPARVEAATALRRLGHALVSHEVDDDVLERMAHVASELASELGSGAARSRPVDDMKRRLYATPPADGESMDHFPDCVVSGVANPMGVAMRVHREGDEAVATVRLGPAFEGAPGRAHGGVVAAVFDDAMGFVLSMLSTPAFTGWLRVSYLAPTPVGEELEFRARLAERDGRKLLVSGEARHEGALVARAEGLFVTIPPERLGVAVGVDGSPVRPGG